MNNMSSEQTPLLSNSTPSAPPRKPLSNEDNLTKFRIAIGINVDETGRADLEATRKGPRGLYKEIISTQRSLYWQSQAIEILYYGAIIGQILIGAFLASLGSLPTLHPATITVLGIANTFTAGILALLKGQGLPDRLRKNEFQMKRVQDFIEETDIRLALAGEGTLTSEELDMVVGQIFDKYNNARDTAEINSPSTYAHQNEGATNSVQATDGSGDGQLSGLKALARRSTTDQNDAGNGKGKLVVD